MTRHRWTIAAVTFLVGEALLRSYWLAGGRWGYTACDRTHLVHPSDGCGASSVGTVPFWDGWGALGVCVVLLLLVGRASARMLWVAAAALATVAFPLHLFFEIPAALVGRPADWRDLLGRLALVGGAVTFAGLASGPPRERTYRPVAGWARRSAYVAVVLPVLGWAVPHGLWLLGVPFGISAAELDDIRRNLSVGAGVAITVVPPAAGLLVLGLVQQWGQVFPGWMPLVGGRAVPRLLALVPAAGVAVALMTYGGLSTLVFLRSLGSWSDVVRDWAVSGTLLVFLGWGVALGVTAIGYHRATA